MPNINTLLDDHVTLQLECVDRVYLNGYVPQLQRPGQLACFLRHHRKKPIVSPALLKQMTDRFVASIHAFADKHHIPIVRFERGQRKDDIAKEHLARFPHQQGVVFIGVAQERAFCFRSSRSKKLKRDGSRRWDYDFYRASLFVNYFYFYIVDRDFGPCFLKFCSYAPFGIKLCLNGHEWAKRQLARRGVAFEELDNGFLSVADPNKAQVICDKLDARHIDRLFRRWLARLPHPFAPRDRAAGYRYLLSIWQMELSDTRVFDRPLSGRYFFEEVIRDNLDLGRPDRIQLLFGRRVTRRTPSTFRTRVVTHGVMPKLSVEYKKSRVKQYFKEERALRTETVINDPRDLGIGRSLRNFTYLRQVARHINNRLLQLERTSHNCVISHRTFESIVLPSNQDGQRTPGLRFGEPRVMALMGALSLCMPIPNGFTNRMLRHRVAGLFEPGPQGYGPSRMTYDLRRLRLKGLIHRIPGSNRYVLTPRGRRVALFWSKSYARVFRPGVARLDPLRPDDAATDKLAAALRRVDAEVEGLIADAKLAA